MVVSDPSAVGAAMAMLDLRLRDLWFAYVELGGNLTTDDLADFLAGRRGIADLDYDMVAQALNEPLSETGLDHPVHYADELGQQDRSSDAS